MTWDPTPWVVGGGASHSPEVARLLAYAATSGAEGIVNPTDLRVRQTAQASNQVRVLSGACLIRSRFAGGQHQTYAARNPDEDLIAVDPTGSGSSRSDLIVARVHDPQYAGEVPSNPNAFQYVRTAVIKGVPASTRRAADLNLGYPAIELARVDLPPSTATITDAMLVDLRRVAIPRKERHLFTYNLEGATVHALTETAAVGQYWPNIPSEVWNVDVPEWATEAKIMATWGGVRTSRSAASGTIFVRLGSPSSHVRTQDQKWALDFSALAGQEMREGAWMAGDDIKVPETMRGTRQPIRMMGRQLTTGGPPRMDNASSITLDIEFVEVAA